MVTEAHPASPGGAVTILRRRRGPPAIPPKKTPGVFANGSTTRPPGSQEIRQVNYTEGLAVGYRWYESQGIQPQFPFGYGLSYTTFGYSHLQVTPTTTDGAKEVRIRFRVTNTGDRAGTETAQAYVELPASTGEPAKRLVGWTRVTLQPGEHHNVEITLSPRDLVDLHPLQYWDAARPEPRGTRSGPAGVGGTAGVVRENLVPAWEQHERGLVVSRRRTTLLGVLLAAGAAAVLTACQPSAGTAAYVGNQRVTDEQLRTDLADAFATPKLKDGVDKQYGGDLSAFRRQLLNDRVRHELVNEAVRRTGVSVSDDDVTRLINTQGGYDRARDDGHMSRELADRHFKDLLLAAELGYAKQNVKRPTEADLRAAYAREAPNQTTAQLGLIQVPDRATLNQVIAELTSDPTKFDEVATRYPGSAAKPTPYTPANVPESIRQKIFTAKPGTILPFIGPGQAGEGQYVAVKVFSVTTPTFDDLRVQLSLQSLSEAYQAGQAYIAALGKEIGVRVNPRYGTWNANTAQIEEAPNPLVTLNSGSPTPTPSPTAPADAGS